MKVNRRALLAALLGFGPAFAAKIHTDDEIYDAVRRKLANDPTVKGGALEIEVKDGVVTLRGKVREEKQKARAEKVAKKIDGVRQIVNQLTVGEPGPR